MTDERDDNQHNKLRTFYINNYTMNKLSPFGIKLYQLIKQGVNSYPKHRRILKVDRALFFNFCVSLSWAFVRSAKEAKENPAVNVVNEKFDVIKEADELFESGHYEECYEVLKQAENVTNVEIQWRIARVLYNMSKESKYNKEERKFFIALAFNIISDQLQAHENNFAVHKWYALLLDAKSTYDGVSERINQLENVKKHMDLAVTLNPNDATTLYMLGEWCYQISEMPWYQRKIAEALFAKPPTSTYEDALEYFLRAEAVQPRFYSLNLLRLGTCYLKLEKEDQAKYYLKLAASYPAKSNDDHLANKEAADLLKRIKK